MSQPSRGYLPFIDWMKTAGIGVIVLGHVGHAMIAKTTPPFYPKQLGVAFFLFITGYTLAGEAKRPLPVVVKRWFEVFAYGLLFAILMSVVGIYRGVGLNTSNYLPLTGGGNVLFNNFPANPTTWYIGTYLHILLLWALLFRFLRIGPAFILAAAALEITARALLVPAAGMYVAYQSFFNWLTVFTMGVAFGRAGRLPTSRGIVPGVLMFALWPIAIGALGWTNSFPYMTSTLVTDPALQWWLHSVLVTVAYSAYAISAFHVLGALPENAVVKFFARNTVIVFIAHMPLYYLMEWWLRDRASYYPRVWFEFFVCFVVLSAVSELIRPRLTPLLLSVRDRALRRLPS